VASEVYDYVMERLRATYLEPGEGVTALSGVTTESFDAVLATRPRSPLDFDARLRALLLFLALPDAASLTAANKRIANLLKKCQWRPHRATSIAIPKVDAEHSVPGRAAAEHRARTDRRG
jgi:glycyl-tRNA synthetase beta chain